MFKMAVLDIDGTLVDDKGRVSKNTAQIISQVKKAGGIVTLCTGRNIRKTLPVIRAAGIDAPFVCMDGTVLYDPVSGSVLKALEMTKQEAFSVLELLKEEDAYIQIADGNQYFKYFKCKEHFKYDVFHKHGLIHRVANYAQGTRYLKSLSQCENIKGPFYQIVVGTEEASANALCAKIRASGLERVEVRDYLWRGYLFIHRRGVKKSNGVKMLCEQFNISLDEVVAIGDERNDIDMIEMAGMGIAMGNAVNSVKKVAKDVTGKNTEDGAADSLKKYFLNRE